MIAGGTGATGRATARRLLAHGWDVDVTVAPEDVVEAGAELAVAIVDQE
jgi:NAD(P)-dependent dehydrogenase (short-subunit alcohol dehydrogenase family)